MIVKLSDYILEQSVSDADVFDIVIEQAQAEMKVSQAMADVYYKQIMMEMYAYDYDETFMEADTENKSFGDKVKNFFSTIWNAIVNAFKWVGRQFQRFWNWLKGLFTHKNKLNEKLKETAINGSEAEVVSAYNEAIEFIKSKKIKPDAIKSFYDVSKEKEILGRICEMYDKLKDQFSSILSNLEDGNYDGMNKQIERCINDMMYSSSGDITKSTLNDKNDWEYSSVDDYKANPKSVDEKRKFLKAMTEFMDYIGGEGRPKLNELSQNMNELDVITSKIQTITRRTDLKYSGEDKITAKDIKSDKMKDGDKSKLIAALRKFGTQIESWTKWIYAKISEYHSVCGAIQAAVIGAGKVYKDSTERSNKIKEYVDEKCESEEYQNASRDERKRLRAQYQAYAEKLYSKIDAKHAAAEAAKPAAGSAFGGQEPGNFSGKGNAVAGSTSGWDWGDARERAKRDRAAAGYT